MLCIALGLPACSSVEPPAPIVVTTVVDNSCKVFKRVSWSVSDTPETATEVRQHNARFDRLCGKK